MAPELLKKYRARLLTQQRQLVQRVLQLEAELHNMEAEREIDHMDHAQEEAVNDELIALDEHSRQEMDAIQAALVRIEDGTDGFCARCGDPIDPKRLEILPTVRYCVQCQILLEVTAQQPPGPGTNAR